MACTEAGKLRYCFSHHFILITVTNRLAGVGLPACIREKNRDTRRRATAGGEAVGSAWGGACPLSRIFCMFYSKNMQIHASLGDFSA
jgi:hypothetical protein